MLHYQSYMYLLCKMYMLFEILYLYMYLHHMGILLIYWGNNTPLHNLYMYSFLYYSIVLHCILLYLPRHRIYFQDMGYISLLQYSTLRYIYYISHHIFLNKCIHLYNFQYQNIIYIHIVSYRGIRFQRNSYMCHHMTDM